MVTLHEIMTSMQRQVVEQGEDIGESPCGVKLLDSISH